MQRRVGEAHRSCGFTLIELVMTLVLVAALAVYAMPKFTDIAAWQGRAFGDTVVVQCQRMLQLALNQRRPIQATITGSSVSFAYVGGASLLSLNCPSSAASCIAEGGTRTVIFNNGNTGSSLTSTGGTMTVTITAGGYAQAYQIDSDSGLMYPTP